MPRHARIVAAGYPMHAILRGIDRGAIFFAETDNGKQGTDHGFPLDLSIQTENRGLSPISSISSAAQAAAHKGGQHRMALS